MLRVVVLGSAAGGGFPQWNCNDHLSRRARSADPLVPGRTQASLAVSADDRRWVLLNASPDLRQQINAQRQLQPALTDAVRSSPISAVVLTGGDVDCVAGLLSLREQQPLALYAHPRVLDSLAGNAIFNVLDPKHVPRRSLSLNESIELMDSSGKALGVHIRAFAVPGKVPLWLEDTNASAYGTTYGDSVGLELSAANSEPVFFIPGCAGMTAELARSMNGARAVFFDGTLWRDDEMIVQRVGTKSGLRMGHMSCSGTQGTIAAFSPLNVRRKIFIHINNTNPLLAADSPERAEAEAAGWEVSYDGMEIRT